MDYQVYARSLFITICANFQETTEPSISYQCCFSLMQLLLLFIWNIKDVIFGLSMVSLVSFDFSISLISLNANCIWIWRVFVLWFFIGRILFALYTQYGFTKREKKRSFLKSLKILYVKVKFHLMHIVNIGLSPSKVIIYYC